MASLFESAGASFGNSLLDAGSKALSSSVNYYFGGKNEKRSNARNQRMSAKDRLENYKYSLAEKTYDYALNRQAYDYSNSEQYRLAQEYATNSAKWNVTGLRSAGLNPILAATNGNFGATFGSTGSMSAGGSSFGGSHTNSGSAAWNSSGARADLLEGLRDVSSARQMETDTQIKENTRPAVESRIANEALRSAYDVQSAQQNVKKIEADTDLVHAEALKAEAMARQIDSNTALNMVRTDNESDSGGVSSWSGLVSSLIRAFLPDFRDSNTARKEIHSRIEKSVRPQVSIPYSDKQRSERDDTLPHVYPSIGPDGIRFIGSPKTLPLRKGSLLHTR